MLCSAMLLGPPVLQGSDGGGSVSGRSLHQGKTTEASEVKHRGQESSLD